MYYVMVWASNVFFAYLSDCVMFIFLQCISRMDTLDMLCLYINRKASLALLRKMIHYITPVLLDEICSQEGAGVNFGSQLVEVLSVVLDNEVNFIIDILNFCNISYISLILLFGFSKH